MQPANNIHDELIEDILSYTDDPYGFVMYAFEWGEGDLANCTGPEPWQEELLKSIRDKMLTPNEAIQVAISSGHGIGKSAFVSWMILWAISTFEDTKGVVTANTETQLKTKTWAELSTWYRRCLIKDWFELTATALYSKDPKHEKTWRIDMIPWSERNTEAFAGLHNKGKRILLIFDEGSAIPDVIYEVSEGALTDADTQIFWFVFGNPTRSTGRFVDCFKKYRHRWETKQIDSRTVSLTNKDQIKKWAEDYGENSDFFKVRVKGEFPNVSDRQFIPSDLVDNARGKHLTLDQYNFAPVIIGVDPAWTGKDEIAVYLRQGLMSKKLASYPKIEDDFLLAGYIAQFETTYNADAVFIDMGYGTGIFSAGKLMGRNWTLVSFGSASSNIGYLNKRAEMWANMKDWLKQGGCIEDDPILASELIGPEYIVKLDGKIVLESKDDMKKRGLSSPNRADALALTFAFPVQSKRKLTLMGLNKPEFVKHDKNIFD